MAKPLFYDVYGCSVEVGTFVAYQEMYEDSDKTYQVIGIDDMSGMLEMLEITDISGDYTEWRANYAIPVKTEEYYLKVQAI